MPRIRNGRIDAPYYIFVRCAGVYSDTDLLMKLGLHGYSPNRVESDLDRHVSVVESGEWILIADDWFYSLWHMKDVREAIVALAATHEVFTCSVGDIDHDGGIDYIAGHPGLTHFTPLQPLPLACFP